MIWGTAYSDKDFSSFFKGKESLALKINGDIKDENGNPLNDVIVDIELIKIDAEKQKHKKTRKVEKVNSNFSFTYSGFHIAKFKFFKKGYAVIKKGLSNHTFSNTGAKEPSNVLDNQEIVLRSLSSLPNLEKGIIKLTLENHLSKPRNSGWSSTSRKSIKYKDIKEGIDFKIEEGPGEDQITLVSLGSKSGFLLPSIDNEKYMNLKESPDIGFEDRIIFTLDKKGNISPDCLYFKTEDEKYGKMKVVSCYLKEGKCGIVAQYHLNANGERNLENL